VLALAPEVRLELGEHTRPERFANSEAGIHRLSDLS